MIFLSIDLNGKGAPPLIASGAGGNDYTFKTIPSEVDIARGLVRWLKAEGVKSFAIVADDGAFQHANAIAMAKAADPPVEYGIVTTPGCGAVAASAMMSEIGVAEKSRSTVTWPPRSCSVPLARAHSAGSGACHSGACSCGCRSAAP